MNRTILLILFFQSILALRAIAQNTVSGTIVDKNNVPAEFLRVAVSVENRTIAGTFTNELGVFEFDAPNGNYIFLATSAFGDTVYMQDSVNIYSNYSFGTIQLGSSYEELDEVVIEMRQKLFIRKPDRLIFNVERSIAASGGNAVDALAITPSVRVRGNDISIVGKGAVLIMVNEQLIKLSGEDLLNFLRSIPSSDIQNIEVISNPPAKYDAEGNNGLININLKKNKRIGWNGNIRLGYGQATYASESFGGNLNYYRNKFSFYVGLNLGEGSIAPNSKKSIYYPNQSWIETNNARYYHSYLNGRSGFEYAINDRSSCGIKYQGSLSLPTIDELINTTILNPIGNSSDSSLNTIATTETKTIDHSFNAFYQTSLDTLGKLLSVDVDYFNYSNISDRSFDSKSYTPNLIIQNAWATQNNVDQLIGVLTSRMDIELPTSFADFMIGGKFSRINNHSVVTFYNRINDELIIDPLQSSDFDYFENTGAAYASMSKEFDKWQFQVGARFEYTRTKGVSITLNEVHLNNYINLFPTAYLVYAPNDSNSFVLNYGRRIDRPPYWRLNPFRQYTSAYAYSEGNPLLRPSYFHNVEFSYTLRDNFVSTIFFSRSINKYDQITYVSTITNVQRTFQKNFLTTTSYGLSESYTFDKWNWLESTNELVIYMNQTVSTDSSTLPKLNGTSAYLSTSNAFVLNKKKTLSGEINFYYQFPEVDGIDYLGDYYSLGMGFRLKLFHEKVSLNCRVIDLLRSDITKVKSTINTIEQRNVRYWDARQLFISLNYNFGKSKLSRNQREATNDDERNRVN